MKIDSYRSNSVRSLATFGVGLALLLALCQRSAEAQSNTFPSSGNAGIGTTTPANPLDVSSNQDAVVKLIGLNNASGGSSAQAALSFFEGATEKVKLAVNSSTATGFVGGARAFQVWNFHNAPIVFGTNSVERLRIDGSGKVGIATNLPMGALDVRLTPNGYAGLLVNYSENNGTYLRAGSASVGDVHIGDIVTRNVLLGESGGVNVGIGTSSPGYKLDVAGQIRSSTGGFRFPDGTVQLTAGGGAGTITGVTPGTGLTGGGTNGTITLTNNDKGSDQFIFKNVADVAGTTQFSAASNNDAVRFAGTGGTTVSFDTGTRKITVDSSGITSSQWTTSGSNINYSTAGNFGIGTTTPGAKLDVVGGIYNTGIRITSASVSGSGLTIKSTDTGGHEFNILATATNITGGAGGLHIFDATANAARMRIGPNGDVGIGTLTPLYKLDVNGEINATGLRINGTSISTGGGGGGTITGVTAGLGLAGGGTSGTVSLTNNDKGSDQFIFKSVANAGGAPQFSAGSNTDVIRFAGAGGSTVTFDAGTKKVTVDSSSITSSQWSTSGSNINYATAGNVGIGTGTPTSKLHVTGDGKITGNLTVDGIIAAKYQDVAEWVPSSEQIPAGTVVVLDSTKSNHVMSSTQAYDTRVAGVISVRPGITLGEGGDRKVLVATTGRVLLMVDASKGPIQIGDLLVTSNIPGAAMKSEAISVGGAKIHRPGTLIGKALEPLEKGKGKILVLLSLQ